MPTRADDRERLHFIIATTPDCKSERLLQIALHSLPEPELLEAMSVMETVSPELVRDWTLENFDRLDRFPNPPDDYISMDEIGEFIMLTIDATERAILLFLWLHFEEIRSAHEDFSGLEKSFDYVISRRDLAAYAKQPA